MTYKGRFSPWDLFMLRGSNGMRTSYNKCALACLAVKLCHLRHHVEGMTE